MKKTRAQKGITLIALIITIVVLLILAAVAINSITGDGILGKAQDAATQYNQAVSDEGDMLNYYELFLAGKAYSQSKASVTREQEVKQADGTTTKQKVTLEVGDKVNYSVDGYTGDWKVLGVENGQLLLVTAGTVGTLNISNYNTGVKQLNDMCAKYANADYATKARSLKVEDVNRIVGYNPDEAKFKHNIEYETGKYGNVVSYKWNENGTHIMYTAPDGSWMTADGNQGYSDSDDDETCTHFKMMDANGNVTDLEKGKTVTYKSNFYRYKPTDYGMETSSNAYAMLFNSGYLWLANEYAYTRFGRVCWGIRYFENVSSGSSAKSITGRALYDSWYEVNESEGVGPRTMAVKAVVYINPDATLTPNGANSWTLVSANA